MKLIPSGGSPDISSSYKDPPKTISDCQKQIGNRELQAVQHLIRMLWISTVCSVLSTPIGALFQMG